LVEAGIADAPLRLYSEGLAGHSTFRSFYEMAGYCQSALKFDP
jgi:hypothetical protein